MTESILLAEETLEEEKIKNTCVHLQNDSVKLLTIRDCKLTFSQLKSILRNVGQAKSLLYLSLNIGIITNERRIDLLCRTIKTNRSLLALLIHGNNIGDTGMNKIAKILLHHPTIVCLDVGDCNLGDESVEAICDLLPPHGKKSGLIELTMSSNRRITEHGWIKLSVSMAASSCLQELYLDYNTIGDLAATSVLVGLASHRHLQVLDLEGTCITDRFAELLLYLIENYPTKLQKINLEENKINSKLLKSIKTSLLDTETESEMSEKTQEQESSEESSDSSESSEDESSEASSTATSRSKDKAVEVKVNSFTSSPQKTTKHALKSDTTKSLEETTWDGEELIEITEPPLVRENSLLKSVQSFGGVNLGQMVSVSIGKGKTQDADSSEDELTEVKPFSDC